MTTVTFDLETIEPQDEAKREAFMDWLKPPENIKKLESQIKWMEEQKESGEAMSRTPLDPDWGEIACIGYKINSGPSHCIMRDSQEPEGEKLVLERFNAAIEQINGPIRWVGHNIYNFDLPFLWKACVRNGVMPPVDQTPSKSDPAYIDTMMEWCGKFRSHAMCGSDFIKIDKLAFILGLEVSKSSDGSKVGEMWREQDLLTLEEYVKQDCDVEYEVYTRLEAFL